MWALSESWAEFDMVRPTREGEVTDKGFRSV